MTPGSRLPMKIAYVLYWNLCRDDGVVRKVITQVKLWEPEVDVRVFVLTPPVSPGRSPIPRSTVFSFSSMRQRLGAMRAMVEAVEAWAPDAIYYRYDPPYPPLLRLLSRFPTVVEINTDDVEEFRLGSRLRYLYNLFTRGSIFSRAVGLIGVTRELVEKPHFAKYGKASLVIGNGIDTLDYPELPPALNARPRLVFMGSAHVRWHGLDKILLLARGAPDLDFELIVPGLADTVNDAPPNVRFHGFLARSEYEPILASADVGLGALALHRVGINEACSLKVREYLAYGLPVVLGGQDTDYPDGADHVLQLPNAPANVSAGAEAIRQFAKRMQGRRVPRALVFPRIDARLKERSRIDFIRQQAREFTR